MGKIVPDNKMVVILNGKGGCGKDTLCNLAAKHFKTFNVSSITPVKEIAEKLGWKGEKDRKSRRFLACLKKALIEYDDLPTKYLYSQYQEFLKSDANIMFAHIREGREIQKFYNLVDCPKWTVLVEREGCEDWGNDADDQVGNYPYVALFLNNGPLEYVEADFVNLLKGLMELSGVEYSDAEKGQPRRKAVDIRWDTDGEDGLDLPNEIVIPDNVDDEEIPDYLSDETGFCHYGYSLEYV